MKIIAMISTHPGIGKTTVLVNVAIGLVNEGYTVMIVNPESNPTLFGMLNINLNSCNPQNLFHSPRGVDVLISNYSIPRFHELDYDYVFLNIGSSHQSLNLNANPADKFIAFTDLSTADEKHILQKLDIEIRNHSEQEKCINMIVPSKIKTGEWENNSSILFLIADYFAPEKIAALIPE